MRNRSGSLLKKCQIEKGLVPATTAAGLSPLQDTESFLLLKEIMEYPQWVEESGRAYEPHRLVVYLQRLAADFHLFYSKHRVLGESAEKSGARASLAMGVRNVIHNGLGLLGVSAPEQM